MNSREQFTFSAPVTTQGELCGIEHLYKSLFITSTRIGSNPSIISSSLQIHRLNSYLTHHTIGRITFTMADLNDAESPETYKIILQRNGIKHAIKDVSVQVPKMAGDQFASKCILVKVLFEDDNVRPLELFVKGAITQGEYAQQLKEILMFEKEAEYFRKLLPDMTEFAKTQKGYDGFLEDILPKCLHASDKFIVFENLLFDGFKMLDKKVLHDFHTAELVIKALAKFHGIFLAFIEEIGMEKFHARYSAIIEKSVFKEEGETIFGGWIQNGIDGAIKILSSKPTTGSDDVLKFLKQFGSRGFVEVCKLLENQSCSMNLNHGDLWNANVMFKTSENGTPESCCIIDLQTIHLGSPVVDLLMYLFIAVNPDIRRSNWETLLQIYYAELKEIVTEKLGKELKFSFEDLMKDFRGKCLLGLFFVMYAIFGFEALDNIEEGAMSSGGDAMENLASTLITSLDRSMEEKGELYSQNIVKSYEEFLNISSEISS